MTTLYKNHQGRFAVEVDRNPKFLRMLMFSDRGVVDVVRFTQGELEKEGYVPHESMPHGALRYALRFSPSVLRKTQTAAEFLEEIMKREVPSLTLKELNEEHRQLTGKAVKFKKKGEAVKALLEAGALQSVEQDKSGANPTQTKESTMSDQTSTTTTPAVAANEKKSTKAPAKKSAEKAPAKKSAEKAPAKKSAEKAPAKKSAEKAPVKKSAEKAPAKKPAEKAPAKKEAGAPDPLKRAKAVAKMTNGSGGMIVKLLLEGKTDGDAIVSAVLKKFPERKVTVSQVAWYKSQLVKAGKLKAK